MKSRFWNREKFDQSADGSARPASVLGWVCLTVVVFHVAIWLFSILVLVSQVGSVESEFTEGAMRNHGGYVVLTNLEILCGYAIISAMFVFLLYPLVSLWLRKKTPTRWGIIWRSLVGLALVTGAFFVRMMAYRPYHINQWFDKYHLEIVPLFPDKVRDLFVLVVYTVVPLLFVAAIFWFYLSKIFSFVQTRDTGSRRISYVVGILLVFGSASAYAVPKIVHAFAKTPESPKMNILVIASDSLRSDHLSFNGYHRETSPHIDALAADSITFRENFTPIGSTLESMTGLMTSQYPHTHGLRTMFPNPDELAAVNRNVPALAGILADNGYDTMVLGDWCAAIFKEVPLGFEEIDVAEFDNFRIWLSQAVYLSHPVVPMYFDNELGYLLFPKLKSFAHYLRPEVVTDRAIEKLDEQKRSGKPFFMTVFTGTNHFAYHAPYPYYQKWSDPDYEGPNKFQVKFDENAFTTRTDWDQDYAKLDAAERQHVIDLYDGCVSQFDDCVGEIIKRLKENGQLENTIVIVTSDHGEDLFEPGATLCHGVSFNGGDQGNQVPLIMHVPGEKPRIVEGLTRNIDVAPTLLELLGIEEPASFEGRSLMPYLKGSEADMGLAVYGETSYPFYRRNLPDGLKSVEVPRLDKLTFIDKDHDFHIVLKDMYADEVNYSKERCLRTEKYKLVFTPGEDGPIHRLYDIVADPHCQVDVQLEHPEMFRRMKWHLWQWILYHKEASINEIENGVLPEEFQVPEAYAEIEWK